MDYRRDNTSTLERKVKGFTLVEMAVVIAIIGILAAVLVPSLTGYVRKAKIAVAIADAKTIKTSVESSLMTRFVINSSGSSVSGAFNKILYLDQRRSFSSSEKEIVGAFTNKSWYNYKKKINSGGASQVIDTVIAKGLDEAFSEEWKSGKSGVNPLLYGKNGTCADYLKNENTNFGLVVVYNKDFSVRMLQIYRKGILVTYINGEYVANANADARFVGTNAWSTIYTDAGSRSTGDLYKISLADKQVSNGKEGGWY